MNRYSSILKIASLLIPALVFNSCYEDKGNYDYVDLPQAEVKGIAETYVSNLLDILDIDPQITALADGQEYECVWMCYDKHDFKKKIDTLSTDRHLSYKMNLPLSTYQLIFAYKNKKTNVTKYVNTTLTVQSAYSSGWYVLKEKGGNTDLDLFVDNMKKEDILFQSLGAAVPGAPRYLGYTLYAYLDKETDSFVKENQGFVVMSDQDMRIIRVADMKEMARFGDLFFEDSPSCKPQFWYVGSEENGFVSDGKLYAYTERNGQLGISKFSYPKEGDYQLSSVFTKNATMSPLLFDLKHGKFCSSDKSIGKVVVLEDDAASTINNEFYGYEPLYFGFLFDDMWTGGKMYAVMEKKSDKSRYIVYIDSENLVYFGEYYLKNRITKIKALDASSKFSKATCFAQNRKFEMMYFSIGDKLYSYDLQNQVEREAFREDGQSAIPSGEKIVMMQHIVFDWYDYMEPTIKEQVEKLVVATKVGDGYKLYLFEPEANNLKSSPIIYEGKGKPAQVFYMSPHMNNTSICY